MSQSSQRPPRRPSLPLLLAGLVVVTGLLMAPTLSHRFRKPDGNTRAPLQGHPAPGRPVGCAVGLSGAHPRAHALRSCL